MLYEVPFEENIHYLRSIVDLTIAGNLKWECVDYNPISLTDEDPVDEKPAFLSHFFEFKAKIEGLPHSLHICEMISLLNGKGDIAINLTKDVSDDYMSIDYALDGYFDEYDDCSCDDLEDRFGNAIPCVLSNLLIPTASELDLVKDEFSLARFYYAGDIPKHLSRQPLVKACSQMFIEHRAEDFHRCVLNTKFRNSLLNSN